MLPDEPTDEERDEELAEDNETPFRPAASPPDDATASDTAAIDNSSLPDDHPATDTNIQPEELYDEGVSGAAEAEEPNKGSAVADYTPPEDTDAAA